MNEYEAITRNAEIQKTASEVGLNFYLSEGAFICERMDTNERIGKFTCLDNAELFLDGYEAAFNVIKGE